MSEHIPDVPPDLRGGHREYPTRAQVSVARRLVVDRYGKAMATAVLADDDLRVARVALDALATMSPEDRAALARWLTARAPEDFDFGAQAVSGLKAINDERERIEAATIKRITEWLRGDEGEQVRMDAVDAGVAPEDALAAGIEAQIAAKARPVIPAPKCETCGGTGQTVCHRKGGCDDPECDVLGCTDLKCRACRGVPMAVEYCDLADCPGSRNDQPCRHCDPSPPCATCDSAYTHGAWLHRNGGKCEACGVEFAGTGMAGVIAVAVLRQWEAGRRKDKWLLPEMGDAVADVLDDLAALLDEHTRKEPRP